MRRGGRLAFAILMMAGGWCVGPTGVSRAESAAEDLALSAFSSPDLQLLPYRFAPAIDDRSPWRSSPMNSGAPVGLSARALREPTIHWDRAFAWAGSNAAGMVIAYRQSQAVWGESRGKFHFKDDLRGDGMALNDEVSHLFAAYRLTGALNAGYQWIGMEPESARRASALEAWLWTFAVEFPIDAYNPDQGFGVSDLVANTIGVIAAQQRAGQADPLWDVKLSVKPSFFNGRSRVIAHTNQQYDDYIYWLTVRPVRSRWIPFAVGVGYSTTHGEYPKLTKEIHIGLGTSLDRVAALIDPSLARYLQPLNFYFFNLGGKVAWR